MKKHCNIWSPWICLLLVWSMIFAPLPRVVRADPPPDETSTATYAVAYVSAAEAAELTNGSLTAAQLTARLIELRDRATAASSERVAKLFQEASAGGTPIPAPVGPDGELIGPPIKLPPSRDGAPNPWRKLEGTPSRPWKWIPTFPVPNPDGGQPGASWDSEEGHWDVDNGKKIRTRWLPDGTSVGDDHQPTPKPEVPPPPFTGIDVNPYYVFGILIIIIIIVLIIYVPGVVVIPVVVLAGVVPAGP